MRPGTSPKGGQPARQKNTEEGGQGGRQEQLHNVPVAQQHEQQQEQQQQQQPGGATGVPQWLHAAADTLSVQERMLAHERASKLLLQWEEACAEGQLVTAGSEPPPDAWDAAVAGVLSLPRRELVRLLLAMYERGTADHPAVRQLGRLSCERRGVGPVELLAATPRFLAPVWMEHSRKQSDEVCASLGCGNGARGLGLAIQKAVLEPQWEQALVRDIVRGRRPPRGDGTAAAAAAVEPIAAKLDVGSDADALPSKVNNSRSSRSSGDRKAAAAPMGTPGRSTGGAPGVSHSPSSHHAGQPSLSDAEVVNLSVLLFACCRLHTLGTLSPQLLLRIAHVVGRVRADAVSAVHGHVRDCVSAGDEALRTCFLSHRVLHALQGLEINTAMDAFRAARRLHEGIVREVAAVRAVQSQRRGEAHAALAAPAAQAGSAGAVGPSAGIGYMGEAGQLQADAAQLLAASRLLLAEVCGLAAVSSEANGARRVKVAEAVWMLRVHAMLHGEARAAGVPAAVGHGAREPLATAAAGTRGPAGAAGRATGAREVQEGQQRQEQQLEASWEEVLDAVAHVPEMVAHRVAHELSRCAPAPPAIRSTPRREELMGTVHATTTAAAAGAGANAAAAPPAAAALAAAAGCVRAASGSIGGGDAGGGAAAASVALRSGLQWTLSAPEAVELMQHLVGAGVDPWRHTPPLVAFLDQALAAAAAAADADAAAAAAAQGSGGRARARTVKKMKEKVGGMKAEAIKRWELGIGRIWSRQVTDTVVGAETAAAPTAAPCPPDTVKGAGTGLGVEQLQELQQQQQQQRQETQQEQQRVLETMEDAMCTMAELLEVPPPPLPPSRPATRQELQGEQRKQLAREGALLSVMHRAAVFMRPREPEKYWLPSFLPELQPQTAVRLVDALSRAHSALAGKLHPTIEAVGEVANLGSAGGGTAEAAGVGLGSSAGAGAGAGTQGEVLPEAALHELRMTMAEVLRRSAMRTEQQQAAPSLLQQQQLPGGEAAGSWAPLGYTAGELLRMASAVQEVATAVGRKAAAFDALPPATSAARAEPRPTPQSRVAGGSTPAAAARRAAAAPSTRRSPTVAPADMDAWRVVSELGGHVPCLMRAAMERLRSSVVQAGARDGTARAEASAEAAALQLLNLVRLRQQQLGAESVGVQGLSAAWQQQSSAPGHSLAAGPSGTGGPQAKDQNGAHRNDLEQQLQQEQGQQQHQGLTDAVSRAALGAAARALFPGRTWAGSIAAPGTCRHEEATSPEHDERDSCAREVCLLGEAVIERMWESAAAVGSLRAGGAVAAACGGSAASIWTAHPTRPTTLPSSAMAETACWLLRRAAREPQRLGLAEVEAWFRSAAALAVAGADPRVAGPFGGAGGYGGALGQRAEEHKEAREAGGGDGQESRRVARQLSGLALLQEQLPGMVVRVEELLEGGGEGWGPAGVEGGGGEGGVAPGSGVAAAEAAGAGLSAGVARVVVTHAAMAARATGDGRWLPAELVDTCLRVWAREWAARHGGSGSAQVGQWRDLGAAGEYPLDSRTRDAGVGVGAVMLLGELGARGVLSPADEAVLPLLEAAVRGLSSVPEGPALADAPGASRVRRWRSVLQPGDVVAAAEGALGLLAAGGMEGVWAGRWEGEAEERGEDGEWLAAQEGVDGRAGGGGGAGVADAELEAAVAAVCAAAEADLLAGAPRYVWQAAERLQSVYVPLTAVVLSLLGGPLPAGPTFPGPQPRTASCLCMSKCR